jgi:hypothetical protein
LLIYRPPRLLGLRPPPSPLTSQANATFEAQTVKLHGASKIKKLALLQALMAKESELTSQPKYNKE